MAEEIAAERGAEGGADNFQFTLGGLEKQDTEDHRKVEKQMRMQQQMLQERALSLQEHEKNLKKREMQIRKKPYNFSGKENRNGQFD